MRTLLPAFLALCFVTGCQSSGGPGLWKLYWTLDVEQQQFDSNGSVIARIPVMDGAEVWWVGDDRIVIESTGRERGRLRGARRTWIQPGAETVHTLDLHSDRIEVSSFSRWLEERRRTQRASMVEALRSARRDGLDVSLYDGGLRFQEHRNGDRGWTTASIVPGTAWRLSGESPNRKVWRNPLLLLGFHGMTPELASAVATRVQRLSPRVVEEFSLPDDGRTLVARRLLRSTVELDHAGNIPSVPEVDAGNREEPVFDELWALVADPAAQPVGSDLRELRFQLSRVMDRSHRETIESAIIAAQDTALAEELYLLLASADPSWVRDQLQLARAQSDVARILACVSALSLAEPTGLASDIDELLMDRALWQDLDEATRFEVSTWLEGVRAWLRLRTRLERTL